MFAQLPSDERDVHNKERLFHNDPRARVNRKADMNEQDRERNHNKMAGIVERVDSSSVLLTMCVALVAHLLHTSSSMIQKKV